MANLNLCHAAASHVRFQDLDTNARDQVITNIKSWRIAITPKIITKADIVCMNKGDTLKLLCLDQDITNMLLFNYPSKHIDHEHAFKDKCIMTYTHDHGCTGDTVCSDGSHDVDSSFTFSFDDPSLNYQNDQPEDHIYPDITTEDELNDHEADTECPHTPTADANMKRFDRKSSFINNLMAGKNRVMVRWPDVELSPRMTI